MRILLANEPRSYREVMAAAVQQLRPHMQVIVVAPDDLDTEVARLEPQFVLCSELTPGVQCRTLPWVMLYPDGKTEAEIFMGGQQMRTADLAFENLLAIIDQSERL